MDAHGLEARERTPASRKLGREDAAELLDGADRLVVAKGKRIREFEAPSSRDEDALTAMLGPTGNLRAPTVRVGKTLLVSFNRRVLLRDLAGMTPSFDPLVSTAWLAPPSHVRCYSQSKDAAG